MLKPPDPELERIRTETEKLVKLHPEPVVRTGKSSAYRKRIITALETAGRRGMSHKELRTVTRVPKTTLPKLLKELLAAGRIEKKGFSVHRLAPPLAEREGKPK